MLNGSNPRDGLFALAFAAFVGFWSLALTGSLPTPQQPHQKQQTASAEEPTKESVQDIAAQAVAKYTEVLAWFTVVLAAVGLGQGCLIFWQGRLARREFISTHRPKLIVRQFQLDAPRPNQPITVHFSIINVGDKRPAPRR
jgi:hypothetical protein